MAAAGAQDENFNAHRGNDAAARLDKGLTDDDLESEIELVSELVLAATSSDGPLHQDEVDHLLGLTPRNQAAQKPVPEKPVTEEPGSLPADPQAAATALADSSEPDSL
jgi:hypothetical protein